MTLYFVSSLLIGLWGQRIIRVSLMVELKLLDLCVDVGSVFNLTKHGRITLVFGINALVSSPCWSE